MSNSFANETKARMTGRYHDWVKKIDINKYLENQTMIEKLHEEKQLARSATTVLKTKPHR